MNIQLSELNDLVLKALNKYGYDEKEAEVIKDILMYAQMRGNNQGIVKLIGNGIPKNPDGKPYEIVKETQVSALIDGKYTHAMIVMNAMTDIAIEKAKNSGIAIAGNFNTADSTGAIGYFASKIAKEGMIGLSFASAPFQTTAPYGSNEALFCTNPLAYGIPYSKGPIVFDMTTSAVAYYGLIEAKTAGIKLPEAAGYDADGNETTDPAQIMSGAIKTMAGHKGSGLALLVQVLAGALVSADSFDSDSDNGGNFVMAIDPNLMRATDDFDKEIAMIVDRIKNARKIDGVDEILLPGERGDRLTRKVLESGEIEVEDNLLSELKRFVEN